MRTGASAFLVWLYDLRGFIPLLYSVVRVVISTMAAVQEREFVIRHDCVMKVIWQCAVIA